MAAQYPRWQVVNASLSGETTAGGLARLPAALKTHGPDLVLLELGANDGLRGLPLELMAKNLTAMVQQIQQQGARVLLFDMRIPPNYGPIYSQRFNATFANLAKSHGLVLVPFLLDGIAGVAGLNQADGIHPNAQAQPQVLMTIWPHLEPQLRRVSID